MTMMYGPQPIPLLPKLRPLMGGLQPLVRNVEAMNARGIPESGPTGLAAFLSKPGLAQALMSFGGAMLSESDRPGGSVGGALGRALPMGMEAYAQGQQNAAIDAAMEGAPPEMQKLLRALPREAQVPALLSMMKKPAPVAVGANERLVDPTTGDAIVDVVPEKEDVPSDIRSFQAYEAMNPEQRAMFREYLAANRPPGTTVNVNAGAESGIQKAIGEAAFNTIRGAEGAQAATQKVATIDRIMEITSNPKFREVSGPLFGNKWGELRSRFADDPEARQLLAEFNALGGQMTMAQLEAFTGPKTDFEFQQAKRLAFNDASMTPEEIAAGLRVYRRAAIEEAQRWADRMLQLDPQRLKFDPEDVRPQLDLARSIRGMTTTQGAGGDPLGLRR